MTFIFKSYEETCTVYIQYQFLDKKKTTNHTDAKQKKHTIISKVKPTFSWQHIDAQLLVKKVDLMSSE